MNQRVEIIGGGFSGLTLAYFLLRLNVPVIVRERESRLGGVISTAHEAWGLAETAATGMLNSELVEDLMAELGVEMAEVSRASRKRFIFRGGPKRWPLSFFESMRFALGLLRFLVWPMGQRPKADETMKQWVGRFFGAKAFDYLVAPALQGIYASSDLSAQAIYDSMFRFKSRRTRRVKYRGTVTPKRGMGAVIQALEQKLNEGGQKIALSEPADSLFRLPTVLAVPATEAAVLLAVDHPLLAAELAKIHYLPVTTVTVAFAESEPRLEGFGCLFANDQGFYSLGVLLNSCTFSDRAVGENQIETWIFGDSKIEDVEVKIRQDRDKLLGGRKSGAPLGLKVTRWPHGIPHYNLALNEARKKLSCPRGLYLTGNYLGRIGLAKILQYNLELAEKIKAEL